MVPDVFDYVATYVRRVCGEGPLCVHVDDVHECQIRQHPNYAKFRSQAVAARAARKPSRLWESMVAMGRMSDMRGENKWRMIVMDCLIPFLRARSWSISRDFRRDLGDVRSDMFEAALSTWEEAAGIPAREVPTLMVKAAVNAAYRRANAHKNESSTDDVEALTFGEDVLDSTLKSSSMIYDADLRDPAVVEQIRGERIGALWQACGLIEAVGRYHEGLRAGLRPKLPSTVATETMLTRSYVTGFNYYYYISDFYPKFIDLPAAAKALGIPISTAYRMVRAGSFPCPTTYMGRSLQVLTRAVMHSLAIADVIVHPDDVDNGAAHASGS